MNSKFVKSVFILSLLGMFFTVPSAAAASKKCYTVVAIAEVKIPGVGKIKNHGTLSNWKCKKEARKRAKEVWDHKDYQSFLQFACDKAGFPRGKWAFTVGYWDRSRDIENEPRWKDPNRGHNNSATCF